MYDKITPAEPTTLHNSSLVSICGNANCIHAYWLKEKMLKSFLLTFTEKTCGLSEHNPLF